MRRASVLLYSSYIDMTCTGCLCESVRSAKDVAHLCRHCFLKKVLTLKCVFIDMDPETSKLSGRVW